MNTGTTLFNQLLSLCIRYDFNQCVERYHNGYESRKFSYWDQFVCMSFAQLTRRESLRDIEVCLRGAGVSLYHLGIRGGVSRNTLARANELRDYRVFAEYGRILMREAQKYYLDEELGIELAGAVYAFDSTNIDLCLSLFPWAQVDEVRSGLRVGSLLSLRGNIPCFMHITTEKESELQGMDALEIEPGAMYIFDRGFFDWKRLHEFSKQSACFIIRAKGDLKYRRQRSLPVDKDTGIRSDQLITPFSERACGNFPGVLRRITFFDATSQRRFVFLTNNFALSAFSIAELYKQRWQIELFFKWIKQHLHIQAFFGRSPNAVKTQIWIAISTYLLMAIAKKKFDIPHSIYTISQILSVAAFQKIPLKRALSQTALHKTEKISEIHSNQLDLWADPMGH